MHAVVLAKTEWCSRAHVRCLRSGDFTPRSLKYIARRYDRTVRIFEYNRGRSREVYHTKRMQRIFAVKFSGDAKYVLSGSDEMSIRLWKVILLLRLPLVSLVFCLSTLTSTHTRILFLYAGQRIGAHRAEIRAKASGGEVRCVAEGPIQAPPRGETNRTASSHSKGCLHSQEGQINNGVGGQGSYGECPKAQIDQGFRPQEREAEAHCGGG
jgi:WD40 repeat protein